MTFAYNSLLHLIQTPRHLRLPSLKVSSASASFPLYFLPDLRPLIIQHQPATTAYLLIFFTPQGKGRAFCAGGDVSFVVHDSKKGNWRPGAEFSRKEYRLNYLMATYSKPQVSILDGITMGGGAGASVHGGFRMATENMENMSGLLVRGWMVLKCLLVVLQHILSVLRVLFRQMRLIVDIMCLSL